MLYKNINKYIKQLTERENFDMKQIADRLNTSRQNINNKINRETIRLMDVEKILDVLGYELKIEKKRKDGDNL